MHAGLKCLSYYHESHTHMRRNRVCVRRALQTFHVKELSILFFHRTRCFLSNRVHIILLAHVYFYFCLYFIILIGIFEI